MNSKNIRNVVIAGCGRLGTYIAEYYSGIGMDVMVIDTNQAALSEFSDGFSGFAVLGSAAEYGTLRKAGLEKADMFIAVTESDTINIMCAEIALRHFKVAHVFARIYEPSLEEFSRELGIFAVSPVLAVAEYFLEQIGRMETRKEGSAK